MNNEQSQKIVVTLDESDIELIMLMESVFVAVKGDIKIPRKAYEFAWKSGYLAALKERQKEDKNV